VKKKLTGLGTGWGIGLKEINRTGLIQVNRTGSVLHINRGSPVFSLIFFPQSLSNFSQEREALSSLIYLVFFSGEKVRASGGATAPEP